MTQSMNISPGNLMPDSAIDALYEAIKRKIGEKEYVDSYMKSLTGLNNGVIPDKIQMLVDSVKIQENRNEQLDKLI